MAVSSNMFQNVYDQAFTAKVNWPSDTIKMALVTSSATPSLSSWVHYSDVTNEVSSGNGYTTGGATLGTMTHTATVANSWSQTAATTTAYIVGNVVKPSGGNTYLYRCVVAGTSGGSAPSWPTTVGQTVTDGSVTWVNAGESITVWSSAAVSWTSASFSAQYGVIYDAQSGTSSTEPLIALVNLGSSVTVTSSTFTITPDANVGWFSLTPA